MSQDQKRDAIIEAALKRFAHFGVAKTTMSEIGADLAISKASLYYYFPDKINLYAAVLQHIILEAENNIGPLVDREADPYQAMQAFLEHRTEFIIKYYNVISFIRSKHDIPEELKPVFGGVHASELSRMQKMVEKGVASGKFRVADVPETASLLFECLEGLRVVYLEKAGSFFPTPEQFRNLLKREQQLSQIFFNGLTV